MKCHRRLGQVKGISLAGLLAALTLLSPQSAGAAGPQNGGFETGSLTHWTATLAGGSASAVSSHDAVSGPTYHPVEGDFFALLEAGNVNIYQTISQRFVAGAGDILSGWAFFDAGDYSPYDDSGYVRIVETGATLFEKKVADVGDYGQTPWTYWTYTFGSSGTFTLEAGVRNHQDSSFNSYVGVDDVRLDTVAQTPEPASLAILGSGILGACLRRRRSAPKAHS
jgi:hypothetical protein